MAPAKSATTPAPSRPSIGPPAIQRVRCAKPPLAPSPTAMMSAAARVSRKTTTAAPSMVLPRLFRVQRALGSRFIELSDEWIAAWLQRTQVERCLALARDHLFDAQHLALELLGRRVLIVHRQLESLSGR